MDTQELILEELRQLRNDFNMYARETGERIAALERDSHDLVGNGQPGRVAHLERAVAKLLQWRWWMIGAAAGSSGVISMLAWMASEITHK